MKQENGQKATVSLNADDELIPSYLLDQFQRHLSYIESYLERRPRRRLQIKKILYRQFSKENHPPLEYIPLEDFNESSFITCMYMGILLQDSRREETMDALFETIVGNPSYIYDNEPLKYNKRFSLINNDDDWKILEKKINLTTFGPAIVAQQ